MRTFIVPAACYSRTIDICVGIHVVKVLVLQCPDGYRCYGSEKDSFSELRWIDRRHIEDHHLSDRGHICKKTIPKTSRGLGVIYGLTGGRET